MAAKKKEKIIPENILERRSICENSFEAFIELVQPKRVLGNVHRELIQWMTRQDKKSHQLILLPRDHGKSWIAAMWCAWQLTRNPTLRILLISSTSNLATKQLKFIKDILTCTNYYLHWPEMVHKDEAKREKWTEREISVDHPLRKEWSIRDPSIFTAGLTSNIVGLHCDIAVLDDVVVESNAYLDEGREKVKSQYSYLSSIESVDAVELVVGTRYHPKDLYSELLEMEIDEYDELGNVSKSTPLFEVFERQVESVGDGSGEYLWPRQKGRDGKWFGFDKEILAVKRSQYRGNITRFRAQYYNDPHDIDNSPIQRNLFQYYDSNFLTKQNGNWYFKGNRLNIVAAVDFAYTTGKKSDYSSIVVIGVNSNNDYYILEIDRFKTDKISDYFNRILKLHEKWGFRKIRAEVSLAQSVIVQDIKDNYIRPLGLSLVVDEFRPTKWKGAKDERIMAVLEPKYNNRQIWHYQGGNCQQLEEELIFQNPVHDDIKDALASAIDFAAGKAPVNIFNFKRDFQPVYSYHKQFGGIM